MAIKYDPANNTFSHIGVPFNYSRGNPQPLDNSSIYTSLSAAQEYATNSPVAYVGQIVTVVDSDKGSVDVYKINIDNSLSLVAPAIKIDVTDLPLSAGTGVEFTEDGYVNAKIAAGLSFDKDKKIAVNTGAGLSVDADNNIMLAILELDGGSAEA